MRVIRVGLTLLLFFATAAASAAYPDRPIRIVLGFAAGGGSDILTRKIAPAMAALLGQPVVVENRPGAGGNVAMEFVARATPDGYTLLMGTPGLATNPSLYRNLTLNPMRDFAPVALVGTVQNVLIVNPGLPVASVDDLVRYAKQNPGKLNYASPGVATSQHLAAELFKTSTGVDIVHVPYQGGAQAMTDVMSGQVQLMFNVLPSALPQIKAGSVRALAVTGTRRAEALPDVPTMIEAGVPAYTAITWNGIVAPAGTPPEIIAMLNRAIVSALGTAEMRQQLAAIGQEAAPSTPEEFAQLIRSETEKWRRTIEVSGIKAQ